MASTGFQKSKVGKAAHGHKAIASVDSGFSPAGGIIVILVLHARPATSHLCQLLATGDPPLQTHAFLCAFAVLRPLELPKVLSPWKNPSLTIMLPADSCTLRAGEM